MLKGLHMNDNFIVMQESSSESQLEVCFIK